MIKQVPVLHAMLLVLGVLVLTILTVNYVQLIILSKLTVILIAQLMHLDKWIPTLVLVQSAEMVQLMKMNYVMMETQTQEMDAQIFVYPKQDGLV